MKKSLLIGSVAFIILICSVTYLLWGGSVEACHAPVPQADQARYERFELSRALLQFPDIVLVDQDGDIERLDDIINADQSIFLQFIFTSCPTICPVLSGHFSAFQSYASDNDDNIRMMSVSIDPDYDRPERLKRYGAEFGAQSFWKFYTGDKRDIDKLQSALKNYTTNKMDHRPATYYRDGMSGAWYVYEGFVSAEDLWRDYQDNALALVR